MTVNRDILRVVFGRAIETTEHSKALQPVREAAIRFVAEILTIDPSPTGGGLKSENVAAIDKVFEAMSWVERGVIRYPDAADREAERVELFDTICKIGEDQLSDRGKQAIANILGLEIEFDDETEEAEGESGGD